MTKITLAQLYEHINKALAHSGCANEEVTIVAKVKVPIGIHEGIVPLKVNGVSAKIEEIPQAERDQMSGMYPPTRRATISIDCEIIADEHKGS